MHVERFINQKVIYKALRLIAVGLLVIPPYFLHPLSSLNAASALFGNPAECN